MTVSKISFHNGVPTLFVNDEPLAGVAYITYYTDKNRYKDFSDAGFKLFSVPIFFSGQTINEFSQIPPFSEGIFDDGANFEIFEREIKRIIEAAPDALIFPRINCSVTRKWEDENPDELCDNCRRSCFSSDAWVEETERMLSEFIEYVQTSDYSDNIIGYQIAGGNTEEWFSFDGKGSVGLRSRQKYAEISGKFYEEGDDYKEDADFYNFLCEMTAKRIERLAALVKNKVKRQQVVGVFYGYTFECPYGASGHLALGNILDSYNIDFICSPASYMETRKFGIDHPCMLPVDSLKKHGKLYFVENDVRTDLSRAPNDLPRYNTPIWFGPERETSLELVKQHFARALLHGHSQWWFDMWGGWYASEDYMNLMKKTLNLARKSLELPMESCAEVGVFIDEKSMLTYTAKEEAYNFRRSLGLMGAAYDVYLADDYFSVCQKYKLCIFIEPTRTTKMTDIISACMCDYIVINQDNCHITSAELRELLKNAGVKLRSESDAVIYENQSYIFIGGTSEPLCYDGKTELLLDGIGRLYLKNIQ